jgi:hypothetical protein
MIDLVERDVRAQQMKDHALRLEGMDEADRSDDLRHRQRVDADVGPDIQGDIAGAKPVAEYRDLALGIFAVLVERSSDIGVMLQIQHGAVAAAPDRRAGTSYDVLAREIDLLILDHTLSSIGCRAGVRAAVG